MKELQNIIIKSTTVYNKWFESIKNSSFKARIKTRLRNIQLGNFGDCKNINGNIFELRFFFGGGIRIYYTFQNNVLVLLLCGGNKSSQKRDIEKAKQIIKEEGL